MRQGIDICPGPKKTEPSVTFEQKYAGAIFFRFRFPIIDFHDSLGMFNLCERLHFGGGSAVVKDQLRLLSLDYF